ncbi:MAG: RNA polymerase sigma factor FliA [Porticoccaceae bacterium]
MNGAAVYARNRARQKDELASEHLLLVKRIAYHMVARLPASVDADDLIQVGLIGLLEATRGFQEGHGASFETYAGIRIRGAMIDELRRQEWVPRSVQRKARELAKGVRAVENRKQGPATAREVAEHLGLSLDDYYDATRNAAACRVVSIDDDDIPDVGGDGGPQDELQNDAFRQLLAGKIDHLPEREKLVMALYYDEELNLREIGEVLGVGESRVCQIHGQALTRLRAWMKDWIE